MRQSGSDCPLSPPPPPSLIINSRTDSLGCSFVIALWMRVKSGNKRRLSEATEGK
jgi:hypothetical protein